MDEQYPDTPWSLIAQVREGTAEKQAAMQTLLEQYWQPVSEALAWHVAQYQSPIDENGLQEMVLQFLLWVLHPRQLEPVIPGEIRFREHLKSQLAAFLETGTGATPSHHSQVLTLCPPTMFAEPNGGNSLQDVFDEAWIKLLFARALDKLRQASDTQSLPLYQVFCLHDVPELALSREDLEQAQQSSDAEQTILWQARQDFRSHLIADVTDYCPDQIATREELQWLLDS